MVKIKQTDITAQSFALFLNLKINPFEIEK
jgi:hypothetical protein